MHGPSIATLRDPEASVRRMRNRVGPNVGGRSRVKKGSGTSATNTMTIVVRKDALDDEHRK